MKQIFGCKGPCAATAFVFFLVFSVSAEDMQVSATPARLQLTAVQVPSSGHLASENSFQALDAAAEETELIAQQKGKAATIPVSHARLETDRTITTAAECASLLYSLLLDRQLNPEFSFVETVDDFLFSLNKLCRLADSNPVLHDELELSALYASSEEELLSDFLFFTRNRGIKSVAVPLPDQGRIQPFLPVPAVADAPKLVVLCFFAPEAALQETFCDVYNRAPIRVHHRNIALEDFTDGRIDHAVRDALEGMDLQSGDTVVISARGYLLPAAGTNSYPEEFSEGDTVTIYGDVITEADVRQALLDGHALKTSRILTAIDTTLDDLGSTAQVVVDSCYSGRLLREVDGKNFDNGSIDVLVTTSSEFTCATPAGFVNALSLAIRAHQRQQHHDDKITFHEFMQLYLGRSGSTRPLAIDNMFGAVGKGMNNVLMQFEQD